MFNVKITFLSDLMPMVQKYSIFSNIRPSGTTVRRSILDEKRLRGKGQILDTPVCVPRYKGPTPRVGRRHNHLRVPLGIQKVFQSISIGDISDNALTYKSASKSLLSTLAHAQDVQSSLAKFNVSWEFIEPKSPWHGGWWERLVSTVKRPRRTLGRNIFPFRDFATTLTDIQAMVNSRPLTTCSTDSNEVRALTPADLVFGYTSKAILPDTDSITTAVAKTTPLILCDRWLYQKKF